MKWCSYLKWEEGAFFSMRNGHTGAIDSFGNFVCIFCGSDLEDV